MYFSKYNIFTKIHNSNNYLLMNLLTKNADILTPDKAEEILKENYTDIDEYLEKGYITEKNTEERLYKTKYLDFIDKRDSDEIQIFFVTNYSCNFNCSYCYQKDYEWDKSVLNQEVIDSFFRYIDNNFTQRQKYITIFGGEPLLNNNTSMKNIEYILIESKKRNIDTAFVTNGYNIIDYMNILKKGNIREIQVTLDGTKEIHNKRRPLKDKKGTFDKIVDGIDSLLKNNIPVNLRGVVDKENIDNLIELTNYAIDKKWTKKSIFKTQIGRNYDLHSCQKTKNKLYDRIELYYKITELINTNPNFLKFHKPAYSVIKFLFDNGELPDPLFDACPGCKTEWAFDYQGFIYPCTANVGQQDESVGTFYPKINHNEDKILTWQDRDTASIKECTACSYQFICGGGCGSIAKEKNGSIISPDCRPVKELASMGISVYFKESL